MIVLTDIQLKYGDRHLFNGITLTIKEKDRIGLVGRNGAGKTTLLKILAGYISPDSGKIDYPGSTSIGYLKQEIDFLKSRSIMEETMECFNEINTLKKEVEQITHKLTEREDYESNEYMDLIEKLTIHNERLTYLDEGNIEGKTEKVLLGLGFKSDQLNDDIKTLSGGWKMRIELAKLLLTQPDLLLLDEPTNHLDIESIIWLENYLISYPGIIVIISHDVQFLNNTVNRVVEIELGKVLDIKGNYSKFREEKEKQKAIIEAAYVNQRKEIAQKERTITRFMAKATKTKMAQSMQKQLDKVERIEIQQEDTTAMKLRFAEVPRSSRVMIEAKGISKSYGDNTVFSDINLKIERGDKMAFIGQNGQGKTTLAKIIKGALDITDGALEYGQNLYYSYYAQNQTDLLDPRRTVLEIAEDAAPPELRTKVRSILGAFLFSGEDAEKKVSVLSGGEKSRLALACMIMHPCNLMILDEPTNHLDIVAKEILREALIKYSGTLIVVSHDRDFLKGLTEQVLEFKDGQVITYLGDIEYYLEKRELSNMREVELRTQDSTSSDKKTVIDNRSEIKGLQRKIKYCERDIETTEKKIQELMGFLSESPDYDSQEYIQKSKEYKSLQDQLEGKMNEWEQLSMALDGLDQG
ncbi:MAG: ABC-F family ATP-binding cassette domain-containing protein [Saprospiraceae bacterium]|nr:ABC-F family ATP-binding cassette domain-containing protein [Saprospiraceae bacterium]